MSFGKAQELVSKMREDAEFRSVLKAKSDSKALKDYLKTSGYECSRRDLVCAMISCMEDLEKMMQETPKLDN